MIATGSGKLELRKVLSILVSLAIVVYRKEAFVENSFFVYRLLDKKKIP
jgi:hypothetical protein